MSIYVVLDGVFKAFAAKPFAAKNRTLAEKPLAATTSRDYLQRPFAAR